MRIALGVEYDGSQFSGWQSQLGDVRTVQTCVENAVSKVANHPVKIICAGRTDTGVHALGQVVHFDSESVRTDRSWVLGSNINLPDDISILWAQQVSPDFHARFQGQARHYRYIILNRMVRPAVGRQGVTAVRKPLNIESMQKGASYLIGEHDFTSFRALACQAKHPIRTMHRLDVTRRGDFVQIDVVANAFLHHMVRNIAGVLIDVGVGKQKPEWVKQILELRDRAKGGVTAPPFGLYLVSVEYPERFGIPVVNEPLITNELAGLS